MTRAAYIDRAFGRLDVPAFTFAHGVAGMACTVTNVRATRADRKRRVIVRLENGDERERYAADVRTADGKPVMVAIRRIVTARKRARREEREANGAPLRRARRNVEAARGQLARIATRIKRLQTAATSWRRKLAARERALVTLLDRSV